MDWTAGQLHSITFGKSRKLHNKQAHRVKWIARHIPIPYVRLVDQFTHEDLHGNDDSCHEALRRQSYARRMLDAFGKELEEYKGREADFRSYVLTPVLQRQAQGVPDCYAPAIFDAVAEEESEEVTILDATKFYLSEDPIDPIWIDSYRRNIVYIREARWHLSIVMGRMKLGHHPTFRVAVEDHDMVMAGLKKLIEERGDVGDDKYTNFSLVEVEALVFEEVDTFFEEELSFVVRVPYLPFLMS